MDDRKFADKELELLYSSNESIKRAELVFHLYTLLESKYIKFTDCCEKLTLIDPVKNLTRFMDIVYALYLYLEPNIATSSRCLKSDTSDNADLSRQSSRMIEKRFTNKFSDFYLQNSAILIKTIFSILDPIFNVETEGTNKTYFEEPIEFVKNTNDDNTEDVNLSNSVDLKTIYWIVKTEKYKLDEGLTYYENPLQTFDGILSSMFDTLEHHQIESYSDALNVVKRLKSFPIEIYYTIQFMETQRSLKGVELPKIVAQQACDMIQGILGMDVSKYTFLVKFKERIEVLNMSNDIYELVLEFTGSDICRALHTMSEWIKDFLLDDDDNCGEELKQDITKCNKTSNKKEFNSESSDNESTDNESTDNESTDNESNDGEMSKISKMSKKQVSEYSVCCDRNKGHEYYKYCLKYHTTTDLSAEQIHKIGLKEVDRISDLLLENAKLCDNNITTFEEAIEYIKNLSTDPQNIYSDNTEGETEVLAYIKSIDATIKENLTDLFNKDSLPKAELEYKFSPEHQKDSVPAGYYSPPSFDGKNKGTFYMNLRAELLKFGMPTLVCHEAIPGHHFQLSTVSESKSIHPLRKIDFYNGFNAYVEGWALYTEKLGLEIGLYDTPLIMIGHLMDEMRRAARLVIDTGLHHYCWSKQKALDYMNSYCAFPLKNNEIEINRYIGWPGQATSYKIGQLKILELREKRKSVDGFNVKEFNSGLIAKGAVPIDLIDELV
jgi:uncharacterized protein (DUF885 family)